MSADGEIVARYAAAYREAERQREERAAEEAALCRKKLAQLVPVLREQFGVQRVGYFGSLAHGCFHEASDADVYVDRIRRGRHFAAVACLSDALGRQVDLVELHRAAPSIIETIEQGGIDVDG